jgi:protein-S-isoprenylcysteine O-methyltransferase Ste14
MSPQLDEPAWRLGLRAAIRCALFLGVLFGGAGRLQWPRAWFFVALVSTTLAVTIPLFCRENPGILRTRLGKMHGGEPWDTVLYALTMASVLACLAVAGLDARFGWSSLPFEWTYLGLLLFIAGWIPIGLAAATNPFLERTLRIQHERGHVAVTTGPYRVVRHPMYAGILLMTASWPLLLGSIFAWWPWAALAVTLIVRTALEDRTLCRELSGYEEYSQRTRYRLIPEVW